MFHVMYFHGPLNDVKSVRGGVLRAARALHAAPSPAVVHTHYKSRLMANIGLRVLLPLALRLTRPQGQGPGTVHVMKEGAIVGSAK